uniref:WAT1-related protein At1g68170-like n=2 Tax=Nicotiana TaxID=4085 RepID=A0A1S4AVW4_TOBAC|nr:PREDICTED: WAT1-related protein At1g68170-like [Nicotiana tabacum]
MIAWCTKLKGPLYVSSFYPLALIFVAIVGTLVLHEELHLGSIIGSIFIIAGLYIVLWGKAKEMRIAETEALKSIAETEDLKSNNNGVIEIISFAGGNLATAAIVPELETDHQIVTTSAATLQEA